ncbi:hypothetical protein [Polycladidibacter hongkongensis]|uniref:hypothetical protein n=1 Tax=Polycladidibacter hongkongensis TaxID=1647556 RepID=UPI0008371584|nr:hypothetical protein [Pseudovibrio hongkongensis]
MSLGAVVLSWKAQQTLRKSLSSHQRSNLLENVNDAVVFFQEFNETEEAELAASFGWRAVGSEQNLGIHRGMEEAVAALRSDTVIYLENDCQSLSDPIEMARAIEAGQSDLDEGYDVVALRDRRDPGLPFIGVEKYLKHHSVIDAVESSLPYRARSELQTVIRRLVRGKRRANFHLGLAPYVEARPDLRHPEFFKRTSSGNWGTDSRVFQWTNQPFMCRKEFLQEVIFKRVREHPSPKQPHDRQTLETALRCKWWGDRRFKVSIADRGAFTHDRIDR